MAGLKDASQSKLGIDTTLAEVRKLQTNRKYRDGRGLFLLRA